MELVIEIIEIFALVTGVPYIILEVLQKKSMWYFGIATGLACAYSFGVQHLWASMGLNIYYVFVSVWGIFQWARAEKNLEAAEKGADKTVHLSKVDRKVVLWSIAAFVVGMAALMYVLELLNDENVIMDALVTVLSAIATVWLAKSYPFHWLIWVVADSLLTALCLSQGMYWMAALYVVYILSSAYGFFHWRKNGAYV